MDAQRWQQIEEIFQSALDLAFAERERFISDQCGADENLKDEVMKLLADYDSAESFIESPVWTKNQLLIPTEVDDAGDSLERHLKNFPDPMIGRQIGAFRLAREIGRGGMGAVYLAERADGSFRQQVAIKLIKRGMDTDFILRRFRQERQILAALNHQFIARLLDGGTTEDNLPYFVMEFIEGKPLYKYSDRKKLSINERLKLFRQICQAIEFAHRNRVIHRDIKPPNIIVTADGTPKLLDFGIAKVLDPELNSITIDPTATAMRLMTPEYASPEQVCGGEITPASDIYSLGVLLYELLTGHRPYSFQNRAPHEIARVICEEEPDRPSTGITRKDNLLPTGASEATTLAQIYLFRGAANIEDLQRELAGDLEKIILKCLRKEPSERYQTAAALAADITRYLDGVPVVAETRFLVVAPRVEDKKTEAKSLAVLPLKILNFAPNADTGEDFLSVGLADALISRLSGIKRLIVRPTSSVLRLNGDDPFAAGRELDVDFVVDGNIRRVGDKIRVTAQLLDVRENSTHWSESFDEQFTDVLALEDSLSEKVVKSLIPHLTGEEEKQLNKRGTNNADAYEAFLRGRVNWNLQSEEGFARAIGFYRRAVELDPNYALAYTAIAEYHIFLGIHCLVPFAEGAKAAGDLVEKAVALDPSLAAARAMSGFIEVAYNWDWRAAEKHLRRALELNPNSVTAHNWLSTVLLQTGRFDDALKEVNRVVELDPDSILSLHIKAWTLYHSRRFDESIALLRKLLENEPNYAWGLQTYSWALRRVGRFAEAVAPAERSVQLTGENPFYLTNLAAAYAEAGERKQAEEILARLAEISKTRFVSEYMLALVFCALGDKDRAFENLEKSFAARDGWLNWLGVDPQFDVLRDDARYEDLLRRAGNLLAKPSATRTGEPNTDGEKSIAVLPLKLFGTPTGGSGEEEYLGIGLADALVTRLSNVRRLTVRPTSSVLPFGDARTNPFTAGRELGVSFVLDGNVRRVGERIRVTVQLLSLTDNSTRWAESFDEHFTDVLALEDSISEQVVKSLLPKLTGEEQQKFARRGTNSPEAFEAYMRGRYRWNQFTPDSLTKACEAFQTAIELDPNYALAHVGLADFYIWSNIYGMIPSKDAVALAQAAANRAIELDDKLGEAYASLGLTFQNRFSWAKAEQLYKQSLELAPNYTHAHEWWAAQLVGHGNFEEGIKESKIAERLDPLSLRTKTLTAWTFYQARRFDEALERGRQIVDLDANYPQGHLQVGLDLLAMGRAQEALPHLQKFDAMIPNSGLAKYQLCFALVAANRRDEARRVLGEIKRLAAEDYVKPYFLAMAHVALDERDAAFENFERAVDESEPWMLWFGTEPMLDSLRDDERFDRILRRMNNPLAGEKKTKSAHSTTNSEKSIAVLPLKLIGGSGKSKDTGGDEYLPIGLADALITRLSNVRRFVVRPTSSVLPYREKQTDAFRAGKELAVDYVVEGTIRRVGKRIRVTAQLLSVSDNSTRWAQSFDEDSADVLALEDSISEQVAVALVPHLTGEEQQQIKKRGTDNAEAFEAYLRGRHHWNTFTEEGFAKALIFYNQAIAVAPDYALAYAGIADYYNLLGIYAVLPFAETSAAAKEAAQTAIRLDASLAEAHSALGFAVLMHDFDWTEAETHLSLAVRLNPNYVTGRIWYCYFLGLKGDWDQAFEQSNRALELDPHTQVVSHTRNLTLYYARYFDEAIAATEKFIEREPSYGLAQLFFSSMLWLAGRTNEALNIANRAVTLMGRTPYTLIWLASAYAADGQWAEAQRLLEEIEELSSRRYCSSYLLAMFFVQSGDAEKALELLEQAWEMRDGRLVWLGIDPQFDLLRTDSRFEKILRLTDNPFAEKSPVGEIAATADAFADAPEATGETIHRTPVSRQFPASKTYAAETEPNTNSQIAAAQTASRSWAKIAAVGAILFLLGSVISAYFFNKYRTPAAPSKYSAEEMQNVVPGKVTALTDSTAPERSPKLSPDKSQILFISNRDGNSEIYVMNFDGGNVRRLTQNKTDEVYANWSPDGKRIVYESSPQLGVESDVWTMDADGANQRDLTNTPGQDSRPVFSPDGSRIAFGSNRNLADRRDSNVWTMNADGGDLKQLTDSNAFESDANFSPDGRKIAYTRAMTGGVFDIWTMNADGANQTNLTKTDKADEALPVYSPSGERLVFSSNLESLSPRYDLWTISATGENRQRVTIHPANDLEAVWLTDTTLIFQSNRETNYKIYQTDVNDTEVPPDKRPKELNSIAILPFNLVNLDSADEPLSLGLAEALTARLGQTRQLTVRPVGAAARKPASAAETLQIGREMNVNFALYTQLGRAGENLTVESILQNVEKGETVWSEKFSLRAGEISSLQAIIAERIVQNLSLELSLNERENLNKKYTDNAEAYQLFLAGRYYLSKRRPEDFKTAIKNFEQAVRLDPNFAPGFAGLAETYALENLYQIPPPPDAYARAKSNAQAALALDDSLADAHAILGYVKFYAERDRAGAEAELRRAVEINPSYATAHHWLALVLAAMNRPAEAVSEAETAQKLDPRSAVIKSATAMTYFFDGQFDKAVAECDAALAIDAGFVPAHKVKRWIYQATGNYEAARTAFLNERNFAGGDSAEPGWIVVQSQVEALGNSREETLAKLERAAADASVANNPAAFAFEVALSYNALGSPEKSLAWLERAESSRAYSFNFLTVDRRLGNLRNDSRFVGLARKLETPEKLP